MGRCRRGADRLHITLPFRQQVRGPWTPVPGPARLLLSVGRGSGAAEGLPASSADGARDAGEGGAVIAGKECGALPIRAGREIPASSPVAVRGRLLRLRQAHLWVIRPCGKGE
ncbi:hypothetical protein Sdia_57100 [Streptomyces diastaticus subsp. diastaticus]|uniref:Uncharacterized protein n=2 Tax=Streptomyces diastaticus group TaxID=2849069 RepID=A0A8H9HTB0_9ACTN|nr:hypothetical protein Srut_02890 [Streptomyces rutgersensis]GFH74942.1 hypothetical protein Sdia_57100 [Streptomyces diastaticus subsp. diastaticus]GGU87105.1 hypothetical protein GCM10010227_46880 [Streptomyces gougerotii]